MADTSSPEDIRSNVTEMRTENVIQQTEDVLQQPTEDVLQQPTEDVLQQQTEDALQQPTEDALQQPTEDVLQQQTEDALQQQTEDVLQQPTEDVLHQPVEEELQRTSLQDVNPKIPQSTTSTGMDGTPMAQNTISNVVLGESNGNDYNEMVYTSTAPETQDTYDQSGVDIDNTTAQNIVANIALHEADKTDEAKMVYPMTTLEQTHQNQHGAVGNTILTQTTVGNVVIHASDKPVAAEMVYPTTTDNTEEPQQSEDVVINHTIAQTTVADVVIPASDKPVTAEMVYSTTSTGTEEPQLANVVLNDTDKPGTGEMVFTVVAMGNNIGDLMQMNSENLPKEVQLSLVQPPPSDDSNLANSGQLSDINQLALIAASIEEPPKDSGSTAQDETRVVHARNPSSANKQDSPVKTLKGRVLCTICNQDFSDLPSMRRHRLIHSEDKPYQCDFCDKSFRRKDNLREHRNIHTQENVYKCERCGKTFPRKYTHKVHMSRFCGKAGQVVSGTETWAGCGKAPNVKAGLAAKSSEPCHICFKTFRDASTLKRHLLTHSDERPYKCSECDKAFRRKDHLQEHIIVHKLVRPFTCRTCGKSFSRKNGLKTHMIRTTHLLGFDDIVVAGQSKDSDDVEIQVVEQVLAADQLVASANEVFPETSPGDNEAQAVSQPGPENETNLQPGDSAVHSVPSEFSQAPRNSENSVEAETTVVLSEKSTKATDLVISENTGTSAQDIESDTVKAFLCEESASGMKNEQGSQTSLSESQESIDQAAPIEGAEASLNDEIPTTPNSKKRKRINTPDRTDQTCTICNKVFRDAAALKRHRLVHSGERPHGCSHCEKRFRRRDHLKAHEIAHHSGITSYECKTCDAVFNTRYALTVHAKSCKNRPSSPREPISEEVKLVGSPESKQCPVCHKVFKDPSTQRRHFRIHSDERPFHCDICSKSFRRKDNLKEHLLCHSDEKPFSCDHCGKSLSRRSSLTSHLNVCLARKSVGAAAITNTTATENPIIPEIQFTEPAVQDMCVSGDPQEISAAHLLATGLTSSVVTSDIASLDVTSSEMTSELVPMDEDIEHGLRDEDDGSVNSFPCEECGKVFRAKWTLKFHERIHTGEKPYTCKTCDRQFRQASHLKIHERTHSGERPYQCQICGRAFIDSSTMKRHERLHKDAADPSAVIDEQHDVTTEDDIISSDVMKEQEYVISNQVINDSNEANEVQQAVEVSIADEGAIQLLVTTANSELANSAQPISTSVVTGIDQSETRLDESNLGQILRECIRSQGVEKVETLQDWQQNHPNERVEQLIYIQTEQEGPSETE